MNADAETGAARQNLDENLSGDSEETRGDRLIEFRSSFTLEGAAIEVEAKRCASKCARTCVVVSG